MTFTVPTILCACATVPSVDAGSAPLRILGPLLSLENQSHSPTVTEQEEHVRQRERGAVTHSTHHELRALGNEIHKPLYPMLDGNRIHSELLCRYRARTWTRQSAARKGLLTPRRLIEFRVRPLSDELQRYLAELPHHLHVHFRQEAQMGLVLFREDQ